MAGVGEGGWSKERRENSKANQRSRLKVGSVYGDEDISGQ